MRKLLILGLIALSFSSCKKEVKPTPSVPTETETKVEVENFYSSKDVQPHLKFNAEYSEYDFIGLPNPTAFTKEELSFNVKENDFDYNKTADFDYYNLSQFDLDKTNFKVIAYHSFGENDSKVVNVQLNSYQAGVQKDALLVDCRFTFETEYYRNFLIEKDGTIIVRKTAVDGLAFNEAGDIVGKKQVSDTTTQVIKYKVDKSGIFNKIK
ncbi:hypothetical protein FFWV33_18570 [Flavobacterium faecale]|uniref:Uncharacterized protein n=1 Tax=Flavobacterium faecale TaxID=1355330 RepID=A0A2S1LID1_9FLAO|nr:hypothetical protein [Flavobacterium faecale]AWG23391.1 hypothetical protein FFWV33_18570 [Flavobacterium faecale]